MVNVAVTINNQGKAALKDASSISQHGYNNKKESFMKLSDE